MSMAIDEILGTEGAGAIIRNALMVFAAEEGAIGELLVRVQRAAEAAERDLSRMHQLEVDLHAATDRARQAEDKLDRLADIQPIGVGIEIDFERRSYAVVRRFKRVVAESLNYADMIAVARRLRADLRGQPSITLHSKRPTLVAARGD